MLSADDLLRTRGVPELRQLVESLEANALGKKSELQQMVGSKYHDFIQSADSIKSMREYTGGMEDKLGAFFLMSQDLVQKTQDLLKHAAEAKDNATTSSMSSKNKTTKTLTEDKNTVTVEVDQSKDEDISWLSTAPDSTGIWSHLESCNLHKAAVHTYLAANEAHTLHPHKNDSQEWRELHARVESAAFLLPTVLQDCRLFLLLDPAQTSCVERAQALAALGLLGVSASMSPTSSSTAGIRGVAGVAGHNQSKEEWKDVREEAPKTTTDTDATVLAESINSDSNSNSDSNDNGANNMFSHKAQVALKARHEWNLVRQIAGTKTKAQSKQDEKQEEEYEQKLLKAAQQEDSRLRLKLLQQYLASVEAQMGSLATSADGTLTDRLVLLTRALQAALLDIQTIFFQPLKLGKSSSGTSRERECHGLLGLCLAQLREDMRSGHFYALQRLGLATKSTSTSVDQIGQIVSTNANNNESNESNESVSTEQGQRGRRMRAYVVSSRTTSQSQGGSSGSQAASDDTYGDEDRDRELRACVDAWLGRAINGISGMTMRTLSSLGSALQTAHLQDRVWRACVSVGETGIDKNSAIDGLNASGNANTNTDNSKSSMSEEKQTDKHDNDKQGELPLARLNRRGACSYTQQDWEITSRELLSHSFHLSSSTDSGVDEAEKDINDNGNNSLSKYSTLLWSAALRAPFMRHVESLLQQACESVLEATRHMLLSALQAEGVRLDVRRMEASAISTNTQNVNMKSSNCSSSSSPLTYLRAEAIRRTMEVSFRDMVRDVSSSSGSGLAGVGEGNDPASSVALRRALNVQCARLAGQLAILLRGSSDALWALAEREIKAQRARKKASKEKTTFTVDVLTDSVEVAEAAEVDLRGTRARSAAQGGLLLLGRLSWLLGAGGRGGFIEDIIGGNDSFELADAAGSAVQQEKTSFDQLRSAFEIADARGSGVLSTSEAEEAILALALGEEEEGDNNSSSSSSRGVAFLNPKLVPSCTLDELSLLCTHLLESDSLSVCNSKGKNGPCVPQKQFSKLIEQLVESSHRRWAKALLMELGGTLTSSLLIELSPTSKPNIAAGEGLTTSQSKRTGKSVPTSLPFQALWMVREVEGEIVYVPGAISSSLQQFLGSLNAQASKSMLSLDSALSVPPVALTTRVGIIGGNGNRSTGSTGSEGGNGEVEGGAQVAHPSMHEQALLVSYVVSRVYTAAAKSTASAYGALLTKVFPAPAAGSSSPLSSSSAAAARADSCALQCVFDLTLAIGVFKRSGVAVEPLKELTTQLTAWESRVDAVNGSLTLPMLARNVLDFEARTSLLYPALHGLAAPVAQTKTQTHSGGEGDNDEELKSSTSTLAGVFSNVKTHRFALLPLSVSSAPAKRDAPKKKDAAAIARKERMKASQDKDEEQMQKEEQGRGQGQGFGNQIMSSLFG